MTFKEWEKACDDLMFEKYGVGIDDIPDQLWHDWYKDDVTVEEAVQWAIDYTNNGEWI